MPAAASARLPTADGSLVGVSVGNVAPAWQKPSRAKKAAGIFGRALFPFALVSVTAVGQLRLKQSWPTARTITSLRKLPESGVGCPMASCRRTSLCVETANR